jgi:hypothetical protein
LPNGAWLGSHPLQSIQGSQPPLRLLLVWQDVLSISTSQLGFKVQGSAPPLARKEASLIEKQTRVLKIPNLKHQILNKSQISIFNDQNILVTYLLFDGCFACFEFWSLRFV